MPIYTACNSSSLEHSNKNAARTFGSLVRGTAVQLANVERTTQLDVFVYTINSKLNARVFRCSIWYSTFSRLLCEESNIMSICSDE